MYSRFTPGPDGVYHRHSVAQNPEPPPLPPETQAIRHVPAAVPEPSVSQRLSARLPGNMELGDLLVLLIALLLLIDAEEDFQTILLTAAAFFLM